MLAETLKIADESAVEAEVEATAPALRELHVNLAFGLWLATLLGRRLTRLLVVPVAAACVLFRPSARRASRAFLRQVGAPSDLRSIHRHMYSFAACTLDRMYLLNGGAARVPVTVHDPEGVLDELETSRGALLASAHFGNYEALRALNLAQRQIRLRFLVDTGRDSLVARVLERLHPRFAGELIEGRSGDPELALTVRQALGKGCTVVLTADRLADRDPGIPVELLGMPVVLPSEPWRLASALAVPVYLCFGVYRDGAAGGAYELHFERFLDSRGVARMGRSAFAEKCARRFATSLEKHLRESPWCWFSFDETHRPKAGRKA